MIFGAEGDVLVYRFLKQLVFGVLEQQPYPLAQRAAVSALLVDIFAVHQHAARGGGKQPVQVLRQGGFAAAGVADQRQQLAILDGKINILQRVGLEGAAGLVNMGQVFNLYRHFSTS